jgi:hypothetical protein
MATRTVEHLPRQEAVTAMRTVEMTTVRTMKTSRPYRKL